MTVVVRGISNAKKVEEHIGRSLKWDSANGNLFAEVKASEAREIKRWAHVDEDTDDVWVR